MGFLLGKQTDTSNPSVRGPHQAGLNLLGENQGAAFLPADYAQILSYYEPFFQRQNEKTFAQAKESAGNLTGSGYGTYMGRAAADAATNQSALIAQLLEQRLRGNQQQYAGLTQALVTPGIGQMGYQPGFLDMVLQGAAQAAPFLAMA